MLQKLTHKKATYFGINYYRLSQMNCNYKKIDFVIEEAGIQMITIQLSQLERGIHFLVLRNEIAELKTLKFFR